MPGSVAPTGAPGLTANAQFTSGQTRISCTNLAVTATTSSPMNSVIRSGEVNTTSVRLTVDDLAAPRERRVVRA